MEWELVVGVFLLIAIHLDVLLDSLAVGDRCAVSFLRCNRLSCGRNRGRLSAEGIKSYFATRRGKSTL